MSSKVVYYFLLGIIFCYSCSEIKEIRHLHYPKNTPFVYSNKIIVMDNDNKFENKNQLNELNIYWDDSIKVVREKLLFFFNPIKKPQIFNPKKLLNSKKNMQNYLIANGYYYADLKDSFTVDTNKNKYQVNTFMIIHKNKKCIIDSVVYNFNNKINALIFNDNDKNNISFKNVQLTNKIISQEVERIYSILKSNGYFSLVRENIIVEVDTLEQKKDMDNNLLANIQFQFNNNVSDSQLRYYFIGEQIYYPNVQYTNFPDSLIHNKFHHTLKNENIQLKYFKKEFVLAPFIANSYIQKNSIFNQLKYINTLNSLNKIGTWLQIEPKIIPRNDTLDFHFFMYPTKKNSIISSIEFSLNNEDISNQSLYGISTSLTYLNRNIFKRAILTSTNFKLGTEVDISNSKNLNNFIFNTFIFTVGQNLIFPKLIIPFLSEKLNQNILNKKTIISVNYTTNNRKDYYQIKSINGFLAYEWKVEKKKLSNLYIYRPINIEVYNFIKKINYDDFLLKNPFLRNSFNQGIVLGQNLNFIKNFKDVPNITKSIRFGIDESGFLASLINQTSDTVYKYLKFETEFKYTTKYVNSELAYRFFGGIGFNFNDNNTHQTLPFIKQFTAGGPYSMRAWGIRQLGLGSSIANDTLRYGTYRDRFGDMQLECNVEYRFHLFNIGPVQIKSALFLDIGNIWNLNSYTQDNLAVFNFNKLYNDIAIGVGTGVRFDLTYLLIRIDFAYKLKDPAREINGGWANIQNLSLYENRRNGFKVDNFAFQFGIGLPF